MELILSCAAIAAAIALYALVLPSFSVRPPDSPGEEPEAETASSLMRELELHREEFNGGKLSREDFDALGAELKRKLIALKESPPEGG